MTSSEGFQKHFNIISKFVCCGFYMNKKGIFYFTWGDCLSVQLPFELCTSLDAGSVVLEPDPNWLVQNVVELEFELSRM